LIPLVAKVGFRANLLGITDTTACARCTIVAIAEAITTIRASSTHPLVTSVGRNLTNLCKTSRTSAHTRRTIVAIAVCAAAIATQAAILAGPDTASATGIDHAVITDFVSCGVISPIIGQKLTMTISNFTAHVTAVAVGAVH
jgi:hypothetical protein